VGYTYVVLGAGRQGVALAYDLMRRGEASRVTLADAHPAVALRAVSRLATLLPDTSCPVTPATCDVSEAAQVAGVLGGADVVISAVPYRFNALLTDLAIAAGASFCDLGGNTSVVLKQLSRHNRAAAAGVSIVPDCGLAPGLGNLLAAHGIAAMDEPAHVHIRCGGLPERPVGPLGYKLSFNFDGLLNEYSGCGEFLRDGERIDVPALTEVEEIEFPLPVGWCEAAVTSGGTSTCAETFRGRLQTYDYKTVRYPGHFALIRALFGLGCFDECIKLADGTTVQPRPLLRRLFEQQLALPDVRDVAVLRCTVAGRHQGQACTRQYDLFDRHDEQTGFAAMERATAFPAALVAYMQARRLIAAGARPAEVAVPVQQYIDELPAHDIRVTLKT
jgi:lysine 6-dehydrogenase